jgi:mRNA-degrading endonuclease HigB of HigAB toxin-antitoxin module
VDGDVMLWQEAPIELKKRKDINKRYRTIFFIGKVKIKINIGGNLFRILRHIHILKRIRFPKIVNKKN